MVFTFGTDEEYSLACMTLRFSKDLSGSAEEKLRILAKERQSDEFGPLVLAGRVAGRKNKDIWVKVGAGRVLVVSLRKWSERNFCRPYKVVSVVASFGKYAGQAENGR